jgi:hypothetical protein
MIMKAKYHAALKMRYLLARYSKINERVSNLESGARAGV